MFINATTRQQISIYSIGPIDICLLVPPHLEKWGTKIFFARSARAVLYPHLKIRDAPHGLSYSGDCRLTHRASRTLSQHTAFLSGDGRSMLACTRHTILSLSLSLSVCLSVCLSHTRRSCRLRGWSVWRCTPAVPS